MNAAPLILDIATVRVLPSPSLGAANLSSRHQAILTLLLPVATGIEYKLTHATTRCAYSELAEVIVQLKKQYPAITSVRRQDLGQMTVMRMEEHMAHPLRRADIF